MLDGIKVAVVSVYVTVPLILFSPVVTVKVAVVIVDTFIFSLNVAVIAVFTAISEALFAGFVDDTVGGVVSNACSVVKLQVKVFVIAFPALSLISVVIVAIYCVE